MRHHLTTFLLLLTFCVIMLGGYTRLTDAGLGCPDWPGCYGQLLAPTNTQEISQANQAFPSTPVDVGKAWTEMVHRYFASSLGLFIVILNVLTFLDKTASRREKSLASALLALVIFQGVLGMWTVTLKLFPLVVMSHLLGGLLTLSLLLALFHQQRPLQSVVSQASPKGLIALSTFLLFIQIGLGGWTSTNYAALSCPNFPLCTDVFWPKFDWQAFDLMGALAFENPLTYLSVEARQTIHMFHRFGALVVSFMILLCAFKVFEFYKRNPSYKRMPIIAGTLVGLLFVQVGLGITNVMAHLPLKVAMLHHGTAVVLLLLMLHLYFTTPKQGVSYDPSA